MSLPSAGKSSNSSSSSGARSAFGSGFESAGAAVSFVVVGLVSLSLVEEDAMVWNRSC